MFPPAETDGKLLSGTDGRNKVISYYSVISFDRILRQKFSISAGGMGNLEEEENKIS